MRQEAELKVITVTMAREIRAVWARVLAAVIERGWPCAGLRR